MREHGGAAVHRRRRTARSATSTCSACRSRPSSATPTCSPRSTSPASRCTRRPRRRRHPIVIAGGHAAFNPETIADFVDAAVIGDGEQAVLAITDIVARLEGARAARVGGTRLLLRLAAHRRRLRAGVLRRRRTCADGRIQRVAPQPRRRRAVAGRQAHRHGPRRVAVPEAAARAARRVGARADVGRDLPRLHPRLPVLPGRHDHPPGARALASPASARWSRRGLAATGFEEVGLLSLSRPTTPRSPTSPRGWPTATRARRPGCRCRRPASTRSTSTSPTSSPATGGARG